jgi:hypothetical protein
MTAGDPQRTGDDPETSWRRERIGLNKQRWAAQRWQLKLSSNQLITLYSPEADGA